VDVSAFIDELRVGENLLAVQGLNRSATSSDFIISAELAGIIAETANGEYPYTREQELLEGLRVTELMYRAADGDEYDYIELANISDSPLDVNGVRITEGIEFTFGPGILEPGEAVVLVSNMLRFRLEYGIGVSVAGVYSGTLSNSGEDIVVLLPVPLDAAIMRFSYSDFWHPLTDGGGLSLGIKDVEAHPAVWSESESWIGVAPNPGDL